MEKEFIPYEQAVALKELGFESPYPIGGYQGGKVFYYEKGELYYDGRPMYSSDAHLGQLLAPLYQQAFRWLLKEHNLYAVIIPTVTMYWTFKTMTAVEGMIEVPPYNHVHATDYETREEAELECLKTLIEKVKKV
jgi:hypothetical protein